MARFNRGYFKIYREGVFGDIGDNLIRLGLFTKLVGMANLKESTIDWNGKPHQLKRGELVTSISEIANHGEIDWKTVKKHLKYLIQRGTISCLTSHGGTIVTIVNYDKYQAITNTVENGMENGMANTVENGVPHIEEVKKERSIYAPKDSKNPLGATPEFLGDSEIEKLLSAVSHSAQRRWLKLYSDPEWIRVRFIRMIAWLEDNSSKAPKKKWASFIGRWLSNDWEEYRKTIPSQISGINTTPIQLETA